MINDVKTSRGSVGLQNVKDVMTAPLPPTEGLQGIPHKTIVLNEKWRSYEFPNGFTTRVDEGSRLEVKPEAKGDAHWITDRTGIKHYIPAGWMQIRIEEEEILF
jgi:hypothetical protein